MTLHTLTIAGRELTVVTDRICSGLWIAKEEGTDEDSPHGGGDTEQLALDDFIDEYRVEHDVIDEPQEFDEDLANDRETYL